MSDFLERLLARNLGAGVPGAVQLRPLARFETPLGPAAIEPIEQSTEEAAISPSSLTPSQHFNSQLASAVEPVNPTPADQSRAAPAYPNLTIFNSPVSNGVQDREIPSSDKPTEHLVERVERYYSERAVILPADTSAETNAIEGGAESGYGEPAPVARQPAYPAPTDLPAPEIEPPQARPQQEPEQVAPVIHLTISKIEVNAAPVAAAPVAARHIVAPARPVRSLDEYLNQRNKG